MGNIPIHPMVVHFPIVFALLTPVATFVALYLIRRRTKPARAWALPLSLMLILLGSSYLAVYTGEAEEERIEAVMPEALIENHESAAEQFILVVAIVGVIGLAGLARGRVGSVARGVATIGTLLIVVAGYRVGKAGGELAYQYSAAAEYIASSAADSD